jgi:uncharacterized protein (TIGR02271 family)
MATTKTTGSTVVGVFENRDRAEQAMAELRRVGFRSDQIGMVARNDKGETVRTDGEGDTYAGEGAVAGVVAGGAIGAAVGAGVLAGTIPVIGPVLAIGTLGTILLNAIGGAVIVGIAGALIGWGIPEEEATYYENEVKAGRYLVTVQANGRAAEARAILDRFGGYDRAGWMSRGGAACATHTQHATAGTAHTATAGAACATGTTRTTGERTVQLKEEQLRATKQPVQAGEVEIHKEVHTERKQITVPVEREEVVIERHPVAERPATGGMHAEEIRIPVREEKVTVTKQPVVREEVTVGKRNVHETKTVTGEVKKEELEVDTTGDAKVRRTTERR